MTSAPASGEDATFGTFTTTPPPTSGGDVPLNTTDEGTNPTASAPAYRGDVPTGRTIDGEDTGPRPDTCAQRITLHSLTDVTVLSPYGWQYNPGQNQKFFPRSSPGKDFTQGSILGTSFAEEAHLCSCGYHIIPLKGPTLESIYQDHMAKLHLRTNP